jgi:hypothetical protein
MQRGDINARLEMQHEKTLAIVGCNTMDIALSNVRSATNSNEDAILHVLHAFKAI